MPLGKRAMEIPVLPFMNTDYTMKVFGRIDLREVICERDTKPSVAQVMNLVNGDTIQKQITGKDGHLDEWLADGKLTDQDVLRRIYLSALVRPPSAVEIEAGLRPLQAAAGNPAARRQAFEDVLWAVFNSKEFLFAH
jgi:hypothetical protein